MKIAIAGAGDVGAYFVEEFCKSAHEVVVLSRSNKQLDPKVDLRVTDYSVEDLLEKINDCDAVVSTLDAPGKVYTAVHSAILEACRKSKKCKRFIPSEFSVNLEDFPDQPYYHLPERPQWRKALKQQTDVAYTIICNGWFTEYVLPSSRRHLKDIGDGWPANHEDKIFQIYGDGKQLVSLTSVRDVARAVLGLLDQDVRDWKEYTYLAGETLTYNELFEKLQEHDSEWKAQPVLFSQVLDSLMSSKMNGEAIAEDSLRIMGFTRCNEIPEDRKLVWGEGALAKVRARTVEDLFKEASDDPEGIV